MKSLQFHNVLIWKIYETIKIIFCNLLNLAVIILWQLVFFSSQIGKIHVTDNSIFMPLDMDKCFDNVNTLDDKRSRLYLCEILV